MIVQKRITKKSAVRPVKASSKIRAARRPVRAAEEVIEDEVIEDEVSPAANVSPEASDLLFEAEDVAELVAQVTGQEVEVTAEDDVVTFEVGDEVYTAEADGDEEILESTRRPLKGKKPVKASRRIVRRATKR